MGSLREVSVRRPLPRNPEKPPKTRGFSLFDAIIMCFSGLLFFWYEWFDLHTLLKKCVFSCVQTGCQESDMISVMI